MVELEPNSCRVCLSITQSKERQLLFSEDGTLSDVGYLYEEVLNLPISSEERVLEYICNSCDLQLKLFKELKNKALETHLLLKEVCKLTDEYFVNNNCVTECSDDSRNEIQEQTSNITDDPLKTEIISIIKDEDDATEEEPEDIQYLDVDLLLENSEDKNDEEYLLETNDLEYDCPSPVTSEKSQAYPCVKCKETFKLKTHLIIHKKQMHPKTKKFSCTLCPKIMFSEEALEVHLNVHKGLPAYQCTDCEKTFKQKAHYNYHMLNHRNERNIICDICQKAFISKSDLKIHKRVHTDERRYKCDICEKLFRAHTHMVNHRYSHFEKQFECPACFQKYVSPYTLRTHFKAVHIGEVPFECQFCEKKFKRKHHLNAHYKTHNKAADKETI